MRFKTKLCWLKSKRSRILLERRVNVTCVDSCTRRRCRTAKGRRHRSTVSPRSLSEVSQTFSFSYH